MRAFIALELTDGIRRSLAEQIADFKSGGADVRWVKPEDIHLTLKFLGDIEENLVPSIAEHLERSAAAFAPFNLSLAGTGVFPASGRPRILWAGIEGAETLQSLQQAVEKEMESLGFPREKRPFRPHITLGRIRSASRLPQLLEKLNRQRDRRFGDLAVGGIALFQSTLRPTGAVYHRLKEARF
jgi:2'-5' RNA ligase